MTGELVDVSVIGSTSLAALISTHTLPADTRLRAAKSLRGLEQFPLIGAPLDGRWEGFRFVLGPWRWLLLVYVFIEPEDRVVVVTIQDGRSSAPATAARG